MKISKSTMNVLKNYSEINQSIVIKEGNEVKTISALKNILSRAVVKENFPKAFAIYDLPTFIGFHSTMSEPDFEFNDDCMMLSDKNGKGKYFYAEPSLVVVPLEKDIDMPESDIKFKLKNDVLAVFAEIRPYIYETPVSRWSDSRNIQKYKNVDCVVMKTKRQGAHSQ